MELLSARHSAQQVRRVLRPKRAGAAAGAAAAAHDGDVEMGDAGDLEEGLQLGNLQTEGMGAEVGPCACGGVSRAQGGTWLPHHGVWWWRPLLFIQSHLKLLHAKSASCC